MFVPWLLRSSVISVFAGNIRVTFIPRSKLKSPAADQPHVYGRQGVKAPSACERSGWQQLHCQWLRCISSCGGSVGVSWTASDSQSDAKRGWLTDWLRVHCRFWGCWSVESGACLWVWAAASRSAPFTDGDRRAVSPTGVFHEQWSSSFTTKT